MDLNCSFPVGCLAKRRKISKERAGFFTFPTITVMACDAGTEVLDFLGKVRSITNEWGS